MRIGYGYDAHAFDSAPDSASAAKLVIGGVTIPYDKGLAAHSDGDVLVHALCDALLGAAGQGDIGQHFPDTKEEFAGIDSRVLLRRVVEIVSQQACRLSNTDITVIAQAPKMAPHIASMKVNLAADLKIDVDRINIKATTTEGLGFEGRGEGIAAHAVVLLDE